jgi:hypothetical protein
MTYSSSLALGRKSAFVGRNQNSVAFRVQERTLGPVSNTIILIVLACLLGLVYLEQVTKTNAYGYTIYGLQQQQQQLNSEHANLEVAAARAQGIDKVASSPEAKSLVSVAPSATVDQ